MTSQYLANKLSYPYLILTTIEILILLKLFFIKKLQKVMFVLPISQHQAAPNLAINSQSRICDFSVCRL